MYEYYSMGVNWEHSDPKSFVGEKYHGFMDLLFEKADTFSLTVSRWQDNKDKSLESALAPYRKKQIKTHVWYGYYAVGIPEEKLPVMTINLYEANEETKKILLNKADDIFLNSVKSGKVEDSRLSLEDLNFFRGSEWILGTVSHEMQATIYNTDDSFDKLLKEIGNWKKEKDSNPLKLSDFIK